jgi:hypothetical protein
MLAKLTQLESVHNIVCQAFDRYIKQVKRNPQVLKAKMRLADEFSIPLRMAQDTAKALNRKIDHDIKQLTLTLCQAICTQVTDGLPREIRDMIYGHLFSKSTSTFQQFFICHKALYVPQMCHWLRKQRDVRLFEAMSVWMDRTFALELIEVGHSSWR